MPRQGGASAFYRAMTLLVVCSPCALVISIPSAILAGIAAGAGAFRRLLPGMAGNRVAWLPGGVLPGYRRPKIRAQPMAKIGTSAMAWLSQHGHTERWRR